MEQSNSLLLNEQALRRCPDPTKPVFVYEWLRYLDRILLATKKADIKSCQQKLLDQLMTRIMAGISPPSRILLAKCITNVFGLIDTYDLFQAINTFNDLLKNKEDTVTNLQIKLTVLCILGRMYEKLGKAVGRSFEESFQLLAKWIKVADSGTRTEILLTISKMVCGLQSTAYCIHKDIYKLIKIYLTDRIMIVRAAAVKCLANLLAEEKSPIWLNEIDSICTICFKSLEFSNYYVRYEMGKVFNKLTIYCYNKTKSLTLSTQPTTPKNNFCTEKDLFVIMASSFLRGGIGGFLKTTGKVLNGVNCGDHKETRVGIALAYVQAVKALGTKWLEKNTEFWIQHLLDIVYKFGSLAYTNDFNQNNEVIFMRRCILYIFQQTLGLMLSEQYQIVVCKIFGNLINKYIACVDSGFNTDEDQIVGPETYSSSETLIVILLELSALVCQLNSSVSSIFLENSKIIDFVFSCLLHPINATRVAAAWCLRNIAVAVPCQCTILIDNCLNKLEQMKKLPEAINGFSLALVALLTSSNKSESGIPFCKPRQIFAFAEEMIKTATQNPKLALKKVSAGWLLISAIISMGSSFIRRNVNQIILLWKLSFPRCLDEARAEKLSGDIFSWECTFELRSGAFVSMEKFLKHCPELVTKDIIKKIVFLIEIALVTLTLVSDLILSHGLKLRSSITVYRVRLYSLLVFHVHLNNFDSLINALLREIVSDITLTDNAQSTSVNSLATSMCAAVESSLLNGWIKNTSESYLEWPFHQAISFGALEYNTIELINQCDNLKNDCVWPEPLPFHVLLIDLAIQLFGKIFSILQSKKKLYLINYFTNNLKTLKSGVRFQAIQLNILTAICLSMKAMGETLQSVKINDEELQRNIVNLILPNLNSEQILLKCLAIETLGRVAQAVGEPQFVASNAQYCFDKLRLIRDEKSRTGFALSLGCLHRYMGSLGSGQHLNTSVSIILALAQDNSSATVQSWSILSLSLIASTGGGMFRGYVEPSLSLCLRLLLSTPLTHVEVIYAVAKLTSALITAVGPELLTTVGTIEHTRTSFIITCSMMYEHSNPLIKAEAIFCFQQLHLFAPRFVQLDRLVKNICDLIYSSHLILRKAAICCLRQLLQREAKEVKEHAQNLISTGLMERSCNQKMINNTLLETGLEGALFELLDVEIDNEIRQHIKECILFLMHATWNELLNFWLSCCKNILSFSANQDVFCSTIYVDENKIETFENQNDFIDVNQDNYDVDDSLQGRNNKTFKNRHKIASRWTTRVFGFDVVQKLMTACDNERAHFDLALAKELHMSNNKLDFLVFHLPDLIKMAFIGATCENTKLRLAGLCFLQEIITKFAKVPEPEFPGHVILEQYQAQVGAALRPAFESETPSSVTAAACNVCSTWISSGIAQDLNDLRRVYQLLVSSLSKLKNGSINTQLFNESAAILEKLSILKAWAKVYIVAITQQNKSLNKLKFECSFHESKENENLLSLVNPELNMLVSYWFASLRDSALLFIPTEYTKQLPENAGTFYTMDSAESCKNHYRNCWDTIILATSYWLKENNFILTEIETNHILKKCSNFTSVSCFYLILGLCIEYLCNSKLYFESNENTIYFCLNSLINIISCEWSKLELLENIHASVEIINFLHRIILTRDNLQTQNLCLKVATQILNVFNKSAKFKKETGEDIKNIWEEKENNKLNSKSSLSFAFLELCFYLLSKQIPQVAVNAKKNNANVSLRFQKYACLTLENCKLIEEIINLLIKIPNLCNEEGVIIILPSILFMIFSVLRESSRIDLNTQNATNLTMSENCLGNVSKIAATSLYALKQISSMELFVSKINESENNLKKVFISILQSSILSLLNMVEEVPKIDKTVIILAITVIICNAPLNLLAGTNIFKKTCDLYKNSLNENSELQITTLQSINLIFQCSNINKSFIQELGASIFAKIQPYVLLNNNQTNKTKSSEKTETNLSVLNDFSNIEVVIIQEILKNIEIIVNILQGNEKQVFLNLLIRCLCHFLCEDFKNNFYNFSVNARTLHEFCLQRLNLIGLSYPETFKSILTTCPSVRSRIESAVQFLTKTKKLDNADKDDSKINTKKSNNKLLHKSIKLALDFDSFC